MQRRRETRGKPDDSGTLHTTQRRTSVHEIALENESLVDPDHAHCDEFDDGSELDDIDLSDARWEAFLADDDELDPEPGPDDFCTFD